MTLAAAVDVRVTHLASWQIHMLLVPNADSVFINPTANPNPKRTFLPAPIRRQSISFNVLGCSRIVGRLMPSARP